jgi:hypothetical protein
MKKRGQTSVESIILLTILLVIISSIIVFRDEVLGTVANTYSAKRAQLLGEKITEAASMIYQQGEGARTVIYVTVPELTDSIVLSGKVMEISYNISGSSNTVFFETDFILNGTVPQRAGSYCLLLQSNRGYVKVSNYNQSC